MEQLHYIQLQILKKLLFAETLRFSELKPSENLENNQFQFHLGQVIKDGLVNKNETGYTLTQKGKEYANRMDTDAIVMKRQGKLSCIQCCMRKIDGKFEFLLYTRLKQPFYGSQGFPSGKVEFGEKTEECTKRELKEEANLEGDPELFMIEHQIVFDKKTKELLEDKYFYFYRFLEPSGELKSNNEAKFEWVKEEDVAKFLKKPFESVDKILYFIKKMKNIKGELTYEEIYHYADNF